MKQVVERKNFVGFVRCRVAYDTNSMDLHQPIGWVVIKDENGIHAPYQATELGVVPVRWVSGYPEPTTWEDWWENPSISMKTQNRIFGSAQT